MSGFLNRHFLWNNPRTSLTFIRKVDIRAITCTSYMFLWFLISAFRAAEQETGEDEASYRHLDRIAVDATNRISELRRMAAREKAEFAVYSGFQQPRIPVNIYPDNDHLITLRVHVDTTPAQVLAQVRLFAVYRSDWIQKCLVWCTCPFVNAVFEVFPKLK